jgi:hypothetical protein
MGYLDKIKIKGKCINTNENINEFLRKNTNNIVVGVGDKVSCFNREKFVELAKNISDRGITYTHTNVDGYICPRDLASIKNLNYCIYYFEPLRIVNSKYQIYNVKSYTINEYNDV